MTAADLRGAARFGAALLFSALLPTFAAAPARAASSDEIQVYLDDINRPGEFGLELHVNTTPSGRSTPDYPGEVVPAHGLRITPEFSWGLSRTLEAGLYMPYVRDPQGTTHFSGPKLRLKWLPLQTGADGTGWFGGLNFEYAWIAPELEQDTRALEMRPIIGYRGREWLLAANPILGWALRGPGKSRKPDFSPSFKIARTVAPGIALGAEYYAELGRIDNFLAHNAQSHTLYFALDFERKPWAFNVGIGRGLTDAVDKWTLKAIFDIPFD